MAADVELRNLTRTIKGLDDTVKKLVRALNDIHNDFTKLKQEVEAASQEQEEQQ
jgi:prefoldin subunit 5